MNNKLIELYKKMHKLIEPICAKECRCSRSCCSKEYCDMAEMYTKEKGVQLEKTNHTKLPFMGTNGCIVPPHLRPMCTLHVCAINSLGFIPNSKHKTEEYFKLREQINELEFEESIS